MAGVLRYNYPAATRWASDPLGLGHFKTVSRAMRFYDEAE